MITVIGLDTQMTLRRHLIALNVFIFVTAVARCIDLFVDPYGSTQVLAPSVQSLLFDLPFPCLLTAFTLLHVSFNQITQLGISSSRIISAVSIGVVLSIHVSLTAATNLLGSSQLKPKLLWMINQTLFTIWALYSCLGFFWSCIHLLKKVSLHPIVLVTAMHSDSNIAQMQEVALTNLMASTERKPSSTSTSHSQGSSSLTVSILKGFRPKIRITDENDQSYSYHSETPSMQTNSRKLILILRVTLSEIYTFAS
ncbi:hypothetical protein HDE_03337 [Halotydeus destructor]|nr:hypothetical protein HDE_03337 [Halotydeus destructor]